MFVGKIIKAEMTGVAADVMTHSNFVKVSQWVNNYNFVDEKLILSDSQEAVAEALFLLFKKEIFPVWASEVCPLKFVKLCVSFSEVKGGKFYHPSDRSGTWCYNE